ncbi:hypothetical protein LCGC14_1301970, partial [marine sediment metagenome]
RSNTPGWVKAEYGPRFGTRLEFEEDLGSLFTGAVYLVGMVGYGVAWILLGRAIFDSTRTGILLSIALPFALAILYTIGINAWELGTKCKRKWQQGPCGRCNGTGTAIAESPMILRMEQRGPNDPCIHCDGARLDPCWWMAQPTCTRGAH